MTDLDAALATPNVAGTTSGAPGRRCKTGRILDDVTDAQRAAILDRLHSDGHLTGWSDHVLAAALTRARHPVSATNLSAHRRRVCGCPTLESETP